MTLCFVIDDFFGTFINRRQCSVTYCSLPKRNARFVQNLAVLENIYPSKLPILSRY